MTAASVILITNIDEAPNSKRRTHDDTWPRCRKCKCFPNLPMLSTAASVRPTHFANVKLLIFGAFVTRLSMATSPNPSHPVKSTSLKCSNVSAIGRRIVGFPVTSSVTAYHGYQAAARSASIAVMSSSAGRFGIPSSERLMLPFKRSSRR